MSRKILALGALPWVFVASVASVAGCSSRGTVAGAGAQVEFGVDMAKRGLWNEALFRFEQAKKLGSTNSTVLNNLAVSYEAVGRFDDALETYRQAVQADPNNRALRQNYSRFLEFYQAFRPKKAAEPKPGEQTPPPTGGTP